MSVFKTFSFDKTDRYLTTTPQISYMNKRVIIVHGWEGNPEEPMLKNIGLGLKSKGFEVEIPEMPDPSSPKISSWTNKLKEVVSKNKEEIYFIGHSIGSQAIIRFLEKENVLASGVVLIAPWFTLSKKAIEEKESEKIARPWLRTTIDFSKVKPAIKNLTCIFSDNDQFVPLNNTNLFQKNLGAKIIIEKNKGHYTAEDKVKENKTAVDEILRMSTSS